MKWPTSSTSDLTVSTEKSRVLTVKRMDNVDTLVVRAVPNLG